VLSGLGDFDSRVENDEIAAIPAKAEIKNLITMIGDHASHLADWGVKGQVEKARESQVRGQDSEGLGHLGEAPLNHALKDGAFHRAEIDKWWPIIKAANIKVE
jgi:hypothetical protein